MIKPFDLRVGNIIGYGKHQVTVTGINHAPERIKQPPIFIRGTINGEDYCYEIENLEGIGLTEERLFKLGFAEKGFVNQDQDDIEWLQLGNLNYRNGLLRNDLDDLPHIKYVHQLQNLYYSLTGQELTIKETA